MSESKGTSEKEETTEDDPKKEDKKDDRMEPPDPGTRRTIEEHFGSEVDLKLRTEAFLPRRFKKGTMDETIRALEEKLGGKKFSKKGRGIAGEKNSRYFSSTSTEDEDNAEYQMTAKKVYILIFNTFIFLVSVYKLSKKKNYVFPRILII